MRHCFPLAPGLCTGCPPCPACFPSSSLAPGFPGFFQVLAEVSPCTRSLSHPLLMPMPSFCGSSPIYPAWALSAPCGFQVVSPSACELPESTDCRFHLASYPQNSAQCLVHSRSSINAYCLTIERQAYVFWRSCLALLYCHSELRTLERKLSTSAHGRWPPAQWTIASLYKDKTPQKLVPRKGRIEFCFILCFQLS